MIVKNESKIIERMLKSVINIIDYFVICDTGSTDNTISVISDFFTSTSCRGIIKKSKFINFEENRNESLRLCHRMGDYILLLDADMVLEVNNFDKNSLKKDLYYMFQKNEKYLYKNTRIIRNDGSFKYTGVTHEVIVSTREITHENLEEKNICINDIGDGGCKDNKLSRDIYLLSKSMEVSPCSRTSFYMANTLFAMEKFEDAIKEYNRRLSYAGWSEEMWYSYYKLGLCYLILNNPPVAIFYFMEAYNINHKRVENLYYIIKYYIDNKKFINAKIYYTLAVQNMKKDGNYLFVEKDIYDKKLFELAKKIKK